MGDIDYALCSRNSSVKVKPDGSVVNKHDIQEDDPNYFYCWAMDYWSLDVDKNNQDVLVPCVR